MLDEVVRQAAARWGERTCLVAPGGWELSFSDLDRISDEVAEGLLARGVTEGDVVVLSLPTSPDHVVAYAACAKVGAITAGVNPRLTDHERAAVIERVQPTLVIDADDRGSSPESVLELLRVPDGAPPPLPRDDDRPVAIVFTSGTTGLPKGAVFCGRQLRYITEVDTGGRWGGRGPALGATSLAHLGPTTKLPGNLMGGGAIHLLERWTAAEALRLTAEHRMAAIAGIPTQLALMLHHPDFEQYDLSCVQAVVIGGAAASPALLEEIRERLGVAVAVRYACTEAGTGLGTSFTDPPEDAAVSVGRPHAGVELSIRDPETGEVVHAATDQASAAGDAGVGEVCLRSPAVMDRYWADPEATAKAFWPDGFVRTGDLGYVDAEGRLVLVGRAKEMYVRGGYNVYPMEVEAVLASHPRVREVAIVPRPDGTMGEIGVAVVVPEPAEPSGRADAEGTPEQLSLDDQLTLDELRSYASDRLAHHKLPEVLVLVDALPLTPMEKVDKRALTELVGNA